MADDNEELPRDEWQAALDELTAAHEHTEVTVEIIGRPLGDQIEAEKLPLVYIEYDYKDDVVIVAVASRDGEDPVLRHMINHPRNIYVHPPDPKEAQALDVVAEDGTQTLVTLYR